MIIKAVQYHRGKKRLRRLEDSGKLLQVLLEREPAPRPSEYVNYFESLYTMFYPHYYMAQEYHADHTGIGTFVWVPGDMLDFAQTVLNTVHQGAELISAPRDYLEAKRHAGKAVYGALLELERHHIFNILQSKGERYTADVVAALCGSISNLQEGDEVTVQFTLRPVHRRALQVSEFVYQSYAKYGSQPRKAHYPYSRYLPWLDTPLTIGAALKYTALDMVVPQSMKGLKRDTDMRTMKEKLDAGEFFDVQVRLLSTSTLKSTAFTNLNTAISAFSALSDRNRYHVTRFTGKKATAFVADMSRRRVPVFPCKDYLTPPEMASYLHFPGKEVPYVKRLLAKKMPVPEGIATFSSIEEAKAAGAVVFGFSDFRGRKKYVAFKDLSMLMRHMYAIGATGSGKTSFLQWLCCFLAEHVGLIFFDVKGDAVDKLLRYLPVEYHSRVVYVDLSSDEYYMPFNFLKQPGMEPYDLATLVVETFVKVFGAQSIQHHSQNMLRQAILAVVTTDPKGSIMEVYRMFADEKYLDDAIAEMESNEDYGYPDVLSFWKNEWKPLKPKQRASEWKAIRNKLQAITQQTRPRLMCCQSENHLPWRQWMDEKRIVLVNLDQGKNEESIQAFFGTLFTSLIKKALFSRSDTPEELRQLVMFILDEFEKFAGQGGDYKDLLALARSYGMGVTLTHQSAKQLDGEMLDQIADNTLSQFSLNIGTGSDTKIARMFPGFEPEDLTGLVPYQAVGRMKLLNPQPFTFNTLPVEEYFADNGAALVTKLKQDAYKRLYNHVSTIKRDINSRYKLVEQNLATEGRPVTNKGDGAKKGRIKREKTAAYGT